MAPASSQLGAHSSRSYPTSHTTPSAALAFGRAVDTPLLYECALPETVRSVTREKFPISAAVAWDVLAALDRVTVASSPSQYMAAPA